MQSTRPLAFQKNKVVFELDRSWVQPPCVFLGLRLRLRLLHLLRDRRQALAGAGPQN
jgi:hypothetical protein